MTFGEKDSFMDEVAAPDLLSSNIKGSGAEKRHEETRTKTTNICRYGYRPSITAALRSNLNGSPIE